MTSPLIRKIYLYLFTIVGLALLSIGTVRLVDLGLKLTIFKKAETPVVYPQPKRVPLEKDKEEFVGPSEEELRKSEEAQLSRERHRTASSSLAMIIVGLPIFLYHWSIIQKETRKEG